MEDGGQKFVAARRSTVSSSESEWIDEVTEPAPAESHAAESHAAEPIDVDAHLLSRIQADIEESLLGGPRCFTQSQIADFAGVTRERADRLWVAMGFAVDEDPDAVMFTQQDADALKTITDMVNRGVISQNSEVAAARSLGQSMSRLAEWQVSLISTHIIDQLADSVDHEPDAIRNVVLSLGAEIIPAVESLQTYVWKRHVASSTGRNVGNPGEEVASRVLVVGFADIVGYTSLTRGLDSAELNDLLERFESASTEIIGRNYGWVVKTVGDEVMFAAESPHHAAEIALQIQQAVLADHDDPQLRVGLAMGPTLVRFGDLYGSVVNKAARLTSSARPGTVLIDSELATQLGSDANFKLRHLRPRRVRGIDRLEQYVLRRNLEP
ncbi:MULTISPECIES: adenylate/guanylate cyclase domain-containing protein [Rhodococcus]|uniref:Putative adenylate cyclase n=1 Tax=Rhodococcus erythropolis (strain PR4 / NBRC 100887) TaxID=234621 RepID=C0ZQJ7_RHOE4|nr:MULTISPECIES: adenylate/guanylate cyclase domain-containing protein [Rhodococcus]MCW0194544.1 adenylate/guanylate cyclase domain-containing protein [Rhodococcus sp. (in: high G+C Gram-positive bacteria)]OXM20976.1 adenylate/guanylate cyclase domain-containing protein [Rhodococcus erythropolis]ALU69168.1 adenylate cyclase [Rhodococcus erythropolis R138]MDN3456083.1 adenylate/guanylate cyclase domain-containing protein [Rhodococcus sp. APC 3903]BAH35765.1 putative adenylate cyclase [Rhodococc